MGLGTILLIIVIVVIFGGGGGYYAHNAFGPVGGFSVGGLVLLLVIIWLVLGR